MKMFSVRNKHILGWRTKVHCKLATPLQLQCLSDSIWTVLSYNIWPTISQLQCFNYSVSAAVSEILWLNYSVLDKQSALPGGEFVQISPTSNTSLWFTLPYVSSLLFACLLFYFILFYFIFESPPLFSIHMCFLPGSVRQRSEVDWKRSRLMVPPSDFLQTCHSQAPPRPTSERQKGQKAKKRSTSFTNFVPF